MVELGLLLGLLTGGGRGFSESFSSFCNPYYHGLGLTETCSVAIHKSLPFCEGIRRRNGSVGQGELVGREWKERRDEEFLNFAVNLKDVKC